MKIEGKREGKETRKGGKSSMGRDKRETEDRIMMMMMMIIIIIIIIIIIKTSWWYTFNPSTQRQKQRQVDL
jgi:heme/copper-type cytochrome/quinol oxidase subunit 2